MNPYFGLALLFFCGFKESTQYSFVFDAGLRNPRSVQSGRSQPIFDFFSSSNPFASLSNHYLQAQKILSSGIRRRYNYGRRDEPVANKDPPTSVQPTVPDPLHHDHHHEPVVQPVVNSNNIGALDTDPECIQGCEANVAPERCHCASHLCDTITCAGVNVCRLVTVGGLVEGSCLPADPSTGLTHGQNETHHQVVGCGLNLDRGVLCNFPESVMFYFDIMTQNCESFQYLGCGGNDNRYTTRASCEDNCLSRHITPGIIDHHNSPPSVSHGHSTPDHVIPTSHDHGHGHHDPTHHDPHTGHSEPDPKPEPVPNPEPEPNLPTNPEPNPIVHDGGALDTDPECIQGCEANVAPERCHCASHLCDTITCTGENVCRLVTVGGLVEGSCLPADPNTGLTHGQNETHHQVVGCGLNLDRGVLCNFPESVMFYFDIMTQNCESFQYLGCGGNDNRYTTRASCEDTCLSRHITPGIIDHHNSPPSVSHGQSTPDHIIVPHDHNHGHGHTDPRVPPSVAHGPGHLDHIEPINNPIEVGPVVNPAVELPVTHNDPPECVKKCTKPLVPEYCHCSEHLCDRLTCAGGTVCRLMRERAMVEAMCVSVDPTTGKSHVDSHHQHPISNACGQRKDKGWCRRFGGSRRFYFDTETQECKRFRYSGCGGNANRFLTKTACEEMCLETRATPGIIDHHNAPLLDSGPSLVLNQPTQQGPIGVDLHGHGSADHHSPGRIITGRFPIMPGTLAILSQRQRGYEGASGGQRDQSHSTSHSGSAKTPTNVRTINLRQLLGNLYSRPLTTTRPFSFGLTALTRPRLSYNGYRRRYTGNTETAKKEVKP